MAPGGPAPPQPGRLLPERRVERHFGLRGPETAQLPGDLARRFGRRFQINELLRHAREAVQAEQLPLADRGDPPAFILFERLLEVPPDGSYRPRGACKGPGPVE